MAPIEVLEGSRYLRLTTYRQDGTPVDTPVWHAVEDGKLFIRTELDSWKVKRLRNDNRVVLTMCDFRGRTASDAEQFQAQARLLDEAGTRHVTELLSRKYSWQFRLMNLPRVFRRGTTPSHIGISVAF